MKALLVALALVAVAGIAHADTADVLHACAKTKGGDLRLSSKCMRGEYAVEWNRQGPQGPDGPAGPGGTSHEIAFKVLTNSVPTTEASYVIGCPNQGKALAGTAWVTTVDTQPEPVLPLIEGSFVSLDLADWQGSEITLTYYVTCATEI